MLARVGKQQPPQSDPRHVSGVSTNPTLGLGGRLSGDSRGSGDGALPGLRALDGGPKSPAPERQLQ